MTRNLVGGNVAVEPAQHFVARGNGRRLVVEQVLHDRGAPYVSAREVVTPANECAHAALRALAPAGTCPVCPPLPAPAPAGVSFVVQLTFTRDAWRMPSWYVPADG